MDNFNLRDMSMKYVNICTMLGPCLNHIGIFFALFYVCLYLPESIVLFNELSFRVNIIFYFKVKIFGYEYQKVFKFVKIDQLGIRT